MTNLINWFLRCCWLGKGRIDWLSDNHLCGVVHHWILNDNCGSDEWLRRRHAHQVSSSLCESLSSDNFVLHVHGNGGGTDPPRTATMASITQPINRIGNETLFNAVITCGNLLREDHSFIFLQELFCGASGFYLWMTWVCNDISWYFLPIINSCCNSLTKMAFPWNLASFSPHYKACRKMMWDIGKMSRPGQESSYAQRWTDGPRQLSDFFSIWPFGTTDSRCNNSNNIPKNSHPRYHPIFQFHTKIAWAICQFQLLGVSARKLIYLTEGIADGRQKKLNKHDDPSIAVRDSARAHNGQQKEYTQDFESPTSNKFTTNRCCSSSCSSSTLSTVYWGALVPLLAIIRISCAVCLAAVCVLLLGKFLFCSDIFPAKGMFAQQHPHVIGPMLVDNFALPVAMHYLE